MNMCIFTLSANLLFCPRSKLRGFVLVTVLDRRTRCFNVVESTGHCVQSYWIHRSNCALLTDIYGEIRRLDLIAELNILLRNILWAPHQTRIYMFT